MWADQVVGQNKIKQDLLQSVINDTLSHAIILEGAEGYGSLPLSLMLSQILFCTNLSSSGACNECKSCQQVRQLIHPDLHFAFPVVKKDGKDRKSTTAKDFLVEWRNQVTENPYITYNEWIRTIAKTTANGDINVKECSEIIQQLNYQSFSGGRKVQIIWMADHLGGNGNKLLKLIEEPPEHTFIILIASSLQSVLQTIISRCRTIKVHRISDEAIVSTLVSSFNLEESSAQQIAFLASGNFSQALTYVYMESDDMIQLILSWMSDCAQSNYQGLRQWSNEFGRMNSEEQKAILQFFIKLLQSILYYKVLGEQYLRLNQSDRQKVIAHPFITSLSLSEIEKISQLCAEMIRQIERYVPGRMVMFNGSLHILTLRSEKATAE